MKPGFLTTFLCTLSAGSLWAADPVKITSLPVDFIDVPPVIDATVWINQTIFNVQNDFSAGSSALPYRTQNTVAFTNIPGAQMFGVPGFQFVTDRNGTKTPMSAWSNEGSIGADYYASLLGALSLPPVETSLLSVQASNIFNAGPLSVGTKGVIHLEGSNLNLKRSGLRAGPPAPSALFFGGSYDIGGAYYNDYGIADLYWGLGNGNVLSGGGNINIDGPRTIRDPYFQMPFPQSPTHQVLVPPWFSAGGSNEVSLPDLSFFYTLGSSNGYASLTYLYTPTPTSTVVQVVFYPTNAPDSTFSNSVSFEPWTADGRARVFVGFHNTEYDIVWRSNVTYSLYLVDNLMVAQSNVNYGANLGLRGAARPTCYSIFRGGPADAASSFYPGDPVFDPTLIYNPNYTAKAVPMFYAAYGAQVGGFPSSPAFWIQGTTNSILDSTNYLGRVDVLGDHADVNRTRVRGEAAVVIRSPDLFNNRFAQVDAPSVNFEVGTVQPELVISNLAPRTVRRINGQIHCWSGIWNNVFTNAVMTNRYQFHVLFVDQNLTGVQAVTTDRFAATAGNLKLDDQLTIARKFTFTGTNMTFTPNGGLTLPPRFNLASSNMVGVLNFTNAGIVTVPFGEAHYGDDRFDTNGQPIPFLSFHNRGTNTSTSLFIKARQTFNSGTLETSGGIMSINAQRLRLLGGDVTVIVTNTSTNVVYDPITFAYVTNVFTQVFTNTVAARLSSRSVVDLSALNLVASNSLIEAGQLRMSVTNNLQAGDLRAPSTWITTYGFEMLQRPTNNNSLMAVTFLSQTVLPFQQATHLWPAKNRGAVNDGYSNNLAVGRLILDAAEDSTFRFAGTKANRGLYVDYLEFRNYASNFFGPRRSLRIDTNLTIYFANANISPEKLTNSFPGRMQWVSTFRGPLSTTNISCYCSNVDGTITTNTYAVNAALATSMDIDTDGDGIANGDDADPLNRCRCSGTLITFDRLFSAELNRSGAGTPGRSVSAAGFRLAIRADQSGTGQQAVLSWDGQANEINVVEISTGGALNNWQIMTNLTTGPTSRRLTVTDDLSSGGQRFYRVRVVPPPQSRN